MDFKFL